MLKQIVGEPIKNKPGQSSLLCRGRGKKNMQMGPGKMQCQKNKNKCKKSKKSQKMQAKFCPGFLCKKNHPFQTKEKRYATSHLSSDSDERADRACRLGVLRKRRKLPHQLLGFSCLVSVDCWLDRFRSTAELSGARFGAGWLCQLPGWTQTDSKATPKQNPA